MRKPKTAARSGAVTPPAIVGRALWIALAASSVGCGVSMRAPKVDSRAEVDVAVNANQARLRMRSLVGPMCGEIERTADQIAAGTTDPAVRRAALRWKIDAVPALSAALFQPEPMTAVLDTWVFFNQMADFFETGAGKEQLGDSAPVAVASCRRLEQEIADVFAAMTVSGDVSTGARLREELGRRPPHPLRDPGPRDGARPGAGAGGARVLVHGRGGRGDHDLDRRPQPEARRLQRAPLPAGALGSGAGRCRPEAGRRAAPRRAQRCSPWRAWRRPSTGSRRASSGSRPSPRARPSRRRGAQGCDRRPRRRADADDRVPPAGTHRGPEAGHRGADRRDQRDRPGGVRGAKGARAATSSGSASSWWTTRSGVSPSSSPRSWSPWASGRWGSSSSSGSCSSRPQPGPEARPADAALGRYLASTRPRALAS